MWAEVAQLVEGTSQFDFLALRRWAAPARHQGAGPGHPAVQGASDTCRAGGSSATS